MTELDLHDRANYIRGTDVLKEELLPVSYDRELLNQLMTVLATHRMHPAGGSLWYFMPMITHLIRFNLTDDIVPISRLNKAARILKANFPPDSRLWQFVEIF